VFIPAIFRPKRDFSSQNEATHIMCSLRLVLALAAGYCVYTALHTPEAEAAISHALAQQPLPADVIPVAIAAAHIAPAVIAMLIVLSLAGLVEASAFCCCCCSRMGVASAREDHVPMGIPVTYSTPYSAYAESGPPTRPPGTGAGAWADGLCGCFNDLKMLAVGMCCPCVVPAQLFERVKRQPYSCFFIVGLFGVASIFASSVQASCPGAGPKVVCTTSGGEVRCDAHAVPASSSQHVPAYCALADGMTSLAWLLLVALVMTVRAAVRAAHSIPPSCCGECDDCCFAFCCLPLTACQSKSATPPVQTPDQPCAS
jgi:Cys-rich protein (TIGR01571 family)